MDDLNTAGPLRERHGAGRTIRLGLIAAIGAWMAPPVVAAGEAFAYFGHAVALSGDTALVGAYREGGKGAAYVFVREGGVWRQQARLVDPSGNPDDFFGWSVALDGDIAVIGAPGDDALGVSNRGAAIIFERIGQQWTLRQSLVNNPSSPNAPTDDQFGFAVAVSGQSLLVGVPGADPDMSFDEGLGYVFTRTAGSWALDGTLRAPFGTSPGSQLGSAVGLDGTTAILGAPGQNLGGGADQGAALVYVRNPSWSLQATLLAILPQPGDRHGAAVSVSGDLVLVGSPGRTTRGSAWAYRREATNWIIEQEFFDSVGQPADNFGWSLAIDGSTALIGAYRRRTSLIAESGASFAFLRTGAGLWTASPGPVLSADDGAPGDWLGFAVALDGNTAISGAVADDVLNNQDQGSAYLHTRAELAGSWSILTKLTADTPRVDAVFRNGFE